MFGNWDGIPENPEKSSFHWLGPRLSPEDIAPCLWNSAERTWTLWNHNAKDPNFSPEYIAKVFNYRGPCMRLIEENLTEQIRNGIIPIISKALGDGYVCGMVETMKPTHEWKKHDDFVKEVLPHYINRLSIKID